MLETIYCHFIFHVADYHSILAFDGSVNYLGILATQLAGEKKGSTFLIPSKPHYFVWVG